jgi:hypothetical protein
MAYNTGNVNILNSTLPTVGNAAGAVHNPATSFNSIGLAGEISGRVVDSTSSYVPAKQTLYGHATAAGLNRYERGNVGGSIARRTSSKAFINNPGAIQNRINMLNSSSATSNDPRFITGPRAFAPYVYPNGTAMLGAAYVPFPQDTYLGGRELNALGQPSARYPGPNYMYYPGAARQVPNPYYPDEIRGVAQLSYPFVSQYPYQLGNYTGAPSGIPYNLPYAYSWPYPYYNPNIPPEYEDLLYYTPGYGRTVSDCRNGLSALGYHPSVIAQVCGTANFQTSGGGGNVAYV